MRLLFSTILALRAKAFWLSDSSKCAYDECGGKPPASCKKAVDRGSIDCGGAEVKDVQPQLLLKLPVKIDEVRALCCNKPSEGYEVAKTQVECDFVDAWENEPQLSGFVCDSDQTCLRKLGPLCDSDPTCFGFWWHKAWKGQFYKCTSSEMMPLPSPSRAWQAKRTLMKTHSGATISVPAPGREREQEREQGPGRSTPTSSTPKTPSLTILGGMALVHAVMLWTS